MITEKAGCFLIKKETKEIALIYRKKQNDYSFPKGHVEKGEKDGVIVSEQHMEMASGSEATVSIGKNEARQLPFISEIKSIMEIYSKELESVPELKKALDDFLYEKEELSTYPWITFLFEEKRFEVKITMDYNGMGIDLLQHYSSSRQENVGRERMEHVTNYIIEVGKRINMQWS